jgi:PhzF family phenazine biosynthesis protein
MLIEAQIINGFVDNGAGGNPAGVVFDADELTNEQKLKVASLVGLSETAFVSSSTVADYKLDFFTPVRQIPHCGHATIAAFSYLKQLGRITTSQSSKETIDGIRSIYFKNNMAYMEQGSPTSHIPTDDIKTILLSLHLCDKDLINGLEPTIVNTGNSFLLIPVKDEEVLHRLQVNLQEVSRLSEKYGLIGFYPFTTNVKDTRFDATASMFAPYYGITEESATGMAAGPLACFLHRNGIVKTNINIQQGKFMSTPSTSLLNVILNIENGDVKNLYVGGKANYEAQKTVEI